MLSASPVTASAYPDPPARSAQSGWTRLFGYDFKSLLRCAGSVKSFDLSPRNRRVAVLLQDNNVALRRWDVTTLVRDNCALVSRNLSSRSKRRRIVA